MPRSVETPTTSIRFVRLNTPPTVCDQVQPVLLVDVLAPPLEVASHSITACAGTAPKANAAISAENARSGFRKNRLAADWQTRLGEPVRMWLVLGSMGC